MATWTEADLAALEAAIKSGVSEVHYAGPPARTIRYHGLAEMIAARDKMRAEIAAAAPQARTSRRVSFSKGFGGPARSGWRRNE